MYGSIEKYRPQKRPQPYNRDVIRNLQGLPQRSRTNQGNSLTNPKASNRINQAVQQLLMGSTNSDNEDSIYQPGSEYKTNSAVKEEESRHMRSMSYKDNVKMSQVVAPELRSSRNKNSQMFTSLAPPASMRKSEVMTNLPDLQPRRGREGRYENSQVQLQEDTVVSFRLSQNNAASFAEQNMQMSMTMGMNKNGSSFMARQIHDKLRVDLTQETKPRMQFGLLNTGGSEMQSRRLMNSVDSNQYGSLKQMNATSRINEAMKHSTTGSGLVLPEGSLGHRVTDTRLGDSYLPALKTFNTTMRAQAKPSFAQVLEFKKEQELEKQSKHVPKLVDIGKVNNSQQTVSLHDRQRNILVHAQMQSPIKKKPDDDSIHQTRFRDWVVKEVVDVVNPTHTKDMAPLRQQQIAQAKKDEQNAVGADWKDSSESSDQYDPLADSDCSSANSDGKPHITSEDLTKTIRQEMREKMPAKCHQIGFWKGLVSTDKEPEYDENGELIPDTAQQPITNFQTIKKMMRLKKRQDAVPENERHKKFVPQTKPLFDTEEKKKYYFDMQNNPEHYQLMTNDMTKEQFSVFEDREFTRIDAMHETRKGMTKLIDKNIEEQRLAKEKRLAEKNKKIDIDTLGEYKSMHFYHEKDELFQDDDELVLMQILMDTSERHETQKALRSHITKMTNKKSMLCPQKVLRMNDFARDIINGIIWDEVRERKVHPGVLFKMGVQQSFGLNLSKQMHRDNKLDKLNRQLRGDHDDTDQEPEIDQELDKARHKDLFVNSQRQQQFFEVAKLMQSKHDNVSTKSSNLQTASYMRFFKTCQKSGTLALPIFSKVKNQVLSLMGQFISEGMAEAMNQVLRRYDKNLHDSIEHQRTSVIHNTRQLPHQRSHQVDEDKVTYIPIREINLDDNGLKDVAFSHILGALATQPSLKRISYVNNEIGAKSIDELMKLLHQESEGELSDLRLTRIKSTKHDLNLLLQALANCESNRLTRLRLSHVVIDEFVLMESLKSMVWNMPQIQELNLSSINIHGRQLSDLMEVISENCAQIQYLNLSNNSVPSNEEWLQGFITPLVSLINTSSKLIDINLSGMNFRESVSRIQWPLAKSKTLQAIHLSDNNIPKAVEINMLMVFGVKSGDTGDENSIAGKLDPRQLKRNPMTGFQIKLEQKIEHDKKKIGKGATLEGIDQYMNQVGKGGETDMVFTYEDATAKIANSVEVRDMKQEKNYLQSYMQGGLGRQHSSIQPLVITRKLGHPELIFNDAETKNTHFKVNAAAKWSRMQSSECWICDQWKYTIVVFSRKNCKQHYGEITDEDRIHELEQMYNMNEDDDLIMVKNKCYPLVFGSITKNSVISMTEMSMFNLFLDEKNIKKNLGNSGERAMRAVLSFSQGMKGSFGTKLSALSDQDWLIRLKDSLPFPEKNVLICNLPETNLSRKINRGESLSPNEIAQRKLESKEDVFVFAGFVEPGKHQIIIKDQLTGKYYAREIVVDARSRDIINCNQVEIEKTSEAIKRFQTTDEVSGRTVEMIDLDNSVFMNFKRYTKKDVADCFEADMRSSNFELIIEDEEDLVECATVFDKNYSAYCMMFHEVAAQFENFPLINLNKDLVEVLYQIGIYAREKARPISERVIEYYREIQRAAKDTNNFVGSILYGKAGLHVARTIMKARRQVDQLAHGDHDPLEDIVVNRVKFAEVLLCVIAVDIEMKKEQNPDAPQDEMMFSAQLRPIFNKSIVPFLTEKEDDQMPVSLDAFREKYVWVEKVNTIMELNLEGIMTVFSKFAEPDIGFTIKSAEKVLKGAGCMLAPRMISCQFDLSQMTVIDESVNADEYDDMEFVEFLEFVVRIAFHEKNGASQDIDKCVAELLRELLILANMTYIEAPTQSQIIQSQANEEDITAFHRYVTKHDLQEAPTTK